MNVLLRSCVRVCQCTTQRAALCTTSQSTEKSFAHLLRHSAFMQMGDMTDRVLRGRVVLETEEDLYIDFGGKFNCVCKRPRYKASSYAVGTEVLIRLKDFELSSRFLGSDTDLTLLEADAVLLGLDVDVQRVEEKSESTESIAAS